MPPAARVSDMHTCPMQTPGTPPIPHVGGPIMLGSFTTLIGGLPAARLGDMAICVGPPDTIAMGSSGVLIDYMPAARLGDLTSHGGSIVLGDPTCMIGETGGGGGGGGGGAPSSQAAAMSDARSSGAAFVDRPVDQNGTPVDCDAAQ